MAKILLVDGAKNLLEIARRNFNNEEVPRRNYTSEDIVAAKKRMDDYIRERDLREKEVEEESTLSFGLSFMMASDYSAERSLEFGDHILSIIQLLSNDSMLSHSSDEFQSRYIAVFFGFCYSKPSDRVTLVYIFLV